MSSHYYFIALIPRREYGGDFSDALEIFRYAGLINDTHHAKIDGRDFVFMLVERPKHISAEFWNECVIPKAETHGWHIENVVVHASLPYQIERYMKERQKRLGKKESK